MPLEEEPVLLLGETGVGKNHVADLIHRLSGRVGPLVVVHTPNIPADLFENELFGHVRGAYTHAEERKKGLIEEADQGTVFLDEIAEYRCRYKASCCVSSRAAASAYWGT